MGLTFLNPAEWFGDLAGNAIGLFVAVWLYLFLWFMVWGLYCSRLCRGHSAKPKSPKAKSFTSTPNLDRSRAAHGPRHQGRDSQGHNQQRPKQNRPERTERPTDRVNQGELCFLQDAKPRSRLQRPKNNNQRQPHQGILHQFRQ